VPGFGQLILVLLEHTGRLDLGFLGPLQAALDGVGALLQSLLDPRHQHPGEHREDNHERDGADDQLGEVRGQRTETRRGQVFHGLASFLEQIMLAARAAISRRRGR